MRALVISHTAGIGGSNLVIFGLLRHVPSEIQPVCVYLEAGPAPAVASDMGVETYVVPVGRTRDVARLGRTIGALARIMRSRRIDVAFAHASKAEVYASPAARLAGIPNLWYQHEVPGLDRGAPGKSRVLQELAGRLPSELVVCNSDFVAALHAQRWRGAPVRRVHPGIPVATLSEHRHAPPQHATIAVVTRLQRWKRVDLALDALALVLRRQAGVRLRIVGAARPDVDADYPAELRARAAALGIADSVEFAGDIPYPGDQLGDADVLLHLSDREAFGLVVEESLARGIPVIVPPSGGGAEIVEDGVDGLLVDPTDTQALASAILTLIEDPEKRARMGAAGRRRALEQFDERRTAAATWQLVAEVAAGR